MSKQSFPKGIVASFPRFTDFGMLDVKAMHYLW